MWNKRRKHPEKILSESELTSKNALEIAQGIEATRRYVSDLGDQNLSSDGKEDTNRSVRKDQKHKWHGVSHAIVVRKTTKWKSVRIKTKNAIAAWKQDIWFVAVAANNQSDRTLSNERRYTQPKAD